MLSGLMSACTTPQSRRCRSATSSCVANDRTPRMLIPTSRPYFFSTSRRFACMLSNTMNTWSRNSNERRKRTTWRLSSGSVAISFLRIVISSCAALYIVSFARITFKATSPNAPEAETEADVSTASVSRAFTTVLNTPRPCASETTYLSSSTSPTRAR
jgi:hypothetical protein